MRITLFCFAQVNSTKFNWSEEFSLLSTVRVSDWTMVVWELFLLPHPPGPHPCENAFSWPPRRFAPSSGWFFFFLKKKKLLLSHLFMYFIFSVSVSLCLRVRLSVINYSADVKIRGQFTGVCDLLPPHASWGSRSAGQVWQQVLPPEPAHWSSFLCNTSCAFLPS